LSKLCESIWLFDVTGWAAILMQRLGILGIYFSHGRRSPLPAEVSAFRLIFYLYRRRNAVQPFSPIPVRGISCNSLRIRLCRFPRQWRVGGFREIKLQSGFFSADTALSRMTPMPRSN